jgi:hypothetical protein
MSLIAGLLTAILENRWLSNKFSVSTSLILQLMIGELHRRYIQNKIVP